MKILSLNTRKDYKNIEEKIRKSYSQSHLGNTPLSKLIEYNSILTEKLRIKKSFLNKESEFEDKFNLHIENLKSSRSQLISFQRSSESN